MNIRQTSIIAARSILLLALAAATVEPARALDTDVYLKSQSLARNDAPRVLVIFDNSGSMSSLVTVTRVPYDPDVNYCTDDLDTLYGISGANAAKPAGCASRAGRIYWSFSSPRQPPASGSTRWFDATKNKCISSSSLSATGFYSGTKIAKWRSGNSGGGWQSLSSASNSTITYVDCEADNANDVNPVNDGIALDDGRQPLASNSTAYGSNPAFNWVSFSSNTDPTLYTSNYINLVNNPALSTTRTRLAIAKDAINAVVDSNPTFWMGLMAFNFNGGSDSNQNGEHGGRVVQQILDLNTPGLRTQFKAHVNNLGADTWTPLAETMWEAYRYWAGLSVDYGDNNSSNIPPPRDANAQNPPSSGPYVSPFQYACQTGYVVYITDGDPTIDGAADTKIRSLPGLSSSTCGHNDATPGTSCLKDLAGWMHNNDVYAGLTGRQTVTTYTIGFGDGMSAAGRDLLDQTARRGGGQFFTAQNGDELSIALESIFVQIQSQTTSFTAPSLSINAFNRQFNRDEIYLSLFKPSNNVAWDGNIKKYKLCTQADKTAGRCTELSDVLDQTNTKITDASGNILDTARSYWSATADGSEVKLGGAGSLVPAPASRTLYTYYTTTADYSALPATPSAGIPVAIGATNAFYTAVTANPTLLGLPNTATSTDVNTLIDWIRGRDSYDADQDGDTTESRWAFGDILHSRTAAITYGCVGSGSCTSSADPIIKLFVGSNDGTIRIINNSTGVEEWAFLPKEMYGMQYNLSQDPNGQHPFGMDNTISFWVRDNNKDGVIDPATDKVFMFVSMRRGGRNIYAFDATPASTMTTQSATVLPKLMWVIEGGTGDFAKLGQTWSVPRIARIRYKCSGTVCNDGNPNTSDTKSRVALMFAGGYDPNQDNAIPATTDTMGNAIYIVDPFTGSRIWWVSDAGATLNLPKMKYSIPSDLSLVDSDRDDNIDRLYVGDTAGQLWRIDLGTQLEQNVLDVGTKGYVFADVGCGSSTSARVHDATGACPSGTAFQDRRKFFYPPSVGMAADSSFSNVANYDLVAIGSGDREDPLDLLTTNLPVPPNNAADREAVHNRIYVFRDYNYPTGPAPDSDTSTTAVWDAPAPLTEFELYDATADTLANPTNAGFQTALTDLKSKKGWFINLKRQSAITVPNGLSTTWIGEKVLARTTLLGGVLSVTTYTPANDTNASTTCQASEGVATQYSLNVLNATAVVDFNQDGTKERSQQIGGGIPSEVVPVIRPDGLTGLVNAGDAAPAGAPLGGIDFVERIYRSEQ